MKRILCISAWLSFIMYGIFSLWITSYNPADASLMDACFTFTTDSGYLPTQLNTCFTNIRTAINGNLDNTNAPGLITSSGDYSVNSLSVSSGINIGSDAGKYSYTSGGIKLINPDGGSVILSVSSNASTLNINGNLSVTGYVYSQNKHEKQTRSVAVGYGGSYADASVLGMDSGTYIGYVPIVSATVTGMDIDGGEHSTIKFIERCGSETGSNKTIDFTTNTTTYFTFAEMQDLVCANADGGLRGYNIQAATNVVTDGAVVTATVTGYVH